MVKILFVCTQNVFRSMSAQYLLEKYFSENNIYDFEVDSAGTNAYDFETPYNQTLKTLFELGVDARNHKNKRLDYEDVSSSELIICMSEHHREFIKNKFNKDSYLFNEITYGSSEDLKDDNEAEYDNLNQFIIDTINYINKSIPELAKNIENYID